MPKEKPNPKDQIANGGKKLPKGRTLHHVELIGKTWEELEETKTSIPDPETLLKQLDLGQKHQSTAKKRDDKVIASSCFLKVFIP